MRFTQAHIDELLDAWPLLRRQPTTKKDVCSVVGLLDFSMEPAGLPKIEDSYRIQIDIPLCRTNFAPYVYERGGRIPQGIDNHVNSDGTLCLGSPWTLRRKLVNPPNLVRFAEECIAPFLYSATWREQGNQGFPFSELSHGLVGLEEDYASILGLSGRRNVIEAIKLLRLRPRLANKRACPCGCGRRLGVCNYRVTLNELRSGLPRSFFGDVLEQINVGRALKSQAATSRSYRLANSQKS